jgi:hypothetical protein
MNPVAIANCNLAGGWGFTDLMIADAVPTLFFKRCPASAGSQE